MAARAELETITEDYVTSEQARNRAQCSLNTLRIAGDTGVLAYYVKRLVYPSETRKTERRARFYKRSELKTWIEQGCRTDVVAPSPLALSFTSNTDVKLDAILVELQQLRELTTALKVTFE